MSRQALNQEELNRVVGGVTDPIVEYTVSWEDANGNRYGYTVRNQPADPADGIISQSVSWEDASGNRYTNTCEH